MAVIDVGKREEKEMITRGDLVTRQARSVLNLLKCKEDS
jgi:hypothetical protein